MVTTQFKNSVYHENVNIVPKDQFCKRVALTVIQWSSRKSGIRNARITLNNRQTFLLWQPLHIHFVVTNRFS